MKRITNNMVRIKNNYATISKFKGYSVYGEKVVKKGNKEYRIWNPYKSKLCAAFHKGMDKKYIMPFEQFNNLLYLGIANGTTASHISDMAHDNAVIYGIDLSLRSMIDLNNMISKRNDRIVPILADASNIFSYKPLIGEVDIIYADIAQPNQTDIIIETADHFLSENGLVYSVIKTRSIAIELHPNEVIKQEIKKIEDKGYKVLYRTRLDPFEKDHGFVVFRKE